MKSALSAPLCALLLLGGCADGAHNSPSLAPRPIEKLSLDDPETVPPQPEAVPADAETQKRIDGFAARLDQGAHDFDSILPAARAAIAKGGRADQGSDAWVEAQQQLTALQAAAGTSSATLSDIDELYLARVDAATGGGSAAGLDALRAVRARAAAQVDAQRARLDGLQEGFSR